MWRVRPGPRHFLMLLAALMAVLAITLHLPGEVSYDSSVQLLEAKTGVSRSWNPPFMSALLQWFGGGTRAMSLFVITCTLLTYSGLVLALDPALGHSGHLRWPRITALAVVIANPVIVLYSGIVWKDVLFAALLCFGCGASLATARETRRLRRIALAVAACISLILAGHVRQQGLLLLPVLFLCPLFAALRGRRPGIKALVGWVVAGCVLFVALEAWTNGRITHDEGFDRDRGLQRMMTYDLIGTSAIAGIGIAGVDASPQQVRDAYSPARIDTLGRRQPQLARQLRAMSTSELGVAWQESVSANPVAFARHRLVVAAHVLNFRDLDQCLPVHVGIDGDASILAQIGLQAGADRRDRWMYAASLPLRWTPWLRHYVTMAGCILLVCIAWRRRTSPVARVVLWFSSCMTGYVLVTSALAIACDFRYLYPAISVASACAIAMLTGQAPRLNSLARSESSASR